MTHIDTHPRRRHASSTPLITGLALLTALGCAGPGEDGGEPATTRTVDASAIQEGASQYAKPGFHAEMVDGRLWVLREGSDALAEFKASGEPAKSVTVLGAVDGLTVRSDDRSTITAYQASKPGFHTEIVDGRMWILREGSEAHSEFLASGEPAKSVTVLGVQVAGGDWTVRSDDRATIDAYLAAR